MTSQALTPAFNRCHKVTMGWEGGWVNDPADPGGPTNFGVTQRVYDAWRNSNSLPTRTVKLISRDEAISIFYHDYWLKSGSNRLFAGVDLAVYDASVNSGVSRGKRWLLRSLSPNNNHGQTVKNICAKRLSFVEGLRNFKRFGRGWSRRIADIQAKGVAWALSGMEAASPAETLRREAEPKREAAKRNGQAAGGTGGITGAGGGAVALDPAQTDIIAGWVLGGLLVAGFALAAYFLWRSWVSKDQAEAFEREAAFAEIEL